MNRIAATDAAGVVNENLAVPLYHQVYLVLRENIRNGNYGPDRAVPAESELCRTFGVSRITVKRAMRMLADEGLVTRHRGRGTFVVESVPPPARRDSLDDLLQSVIAIGASTAMRRIEAGYVPAGADVARQLDCAPGEQVFATSQIRLADRQPIAWIRAYTTAAVAATLRDPETSALPMLAQLQAAGVKVARADQAITATLADPAAASHLGIEVGSPLLRLTRRVFDDKGRAVEWLVALYCGDRYEYRTALSRENLGSRSRWAPHETAEG